jgi:hypothetical protein
MCPTFYNITCSRVWLSCLDPMDYVLLPKTFKLFSFHVWYMWSRNGLSFRSTCVHPWFLMGFVLNNLSFSVWCFGCHCFSFCHFCLSFFDAWLLITPLVHFCIFTLFLQRAITSACNIQVIGLPLSIWWVI